MYVSLTTEGDWPWPSHTH